MGRSRLSRPFPEGFAGWRDAVVLVGVVLTCVAVVGGDLALNYFFVEGCDDCAEPGVFSQGLGTLVIYLSLLGIALVAFYCLFTYFFSFRQAGPADPPMLVFVVVSALVGLPFTLYAITTDSASGAKLACLFWGVLSVSKLLIWKRDRYSAEVALYVVLTGLAAGWPLLVESAF